jgi:GNAT superfamily N-acetyltransferase
MQMVPPGYALTAEVPSVADYQRLRAEAGLSPFAAESARLGLPGTVLGAVMRKDEAAVGMGRVIGDGALFFQLVDIAVQPEHQGHGLGKAIVGALLEALTARIASPAYVSLVADGEAHRLYAQFGFKPVAPKSIGMAQWLQPSSSSSG